MCDTHIHKHTHTHTNNDVPHYNAQNVCSAHKTGGLLHKQNELANSTETGDIAKYSFTCTAKKKKKNWIGKSLHSAKRHNTLKGKISTPGLKFDT